MRLRMSAMGRPAGTRAATINGGRSPAHRRPARNSLTMLRNEYVVRKRFVQSFPGSVTHSEPVGLTVRSEAPFRASVGQASCLSMNDGQDACPTKMAAEVDQSARSGDTGAGMRHRIYEILNLGIGRTLTGQARPLRHEQRAHRSVSRVGPATGVPKPILQNNLHVPLQTVNFL